jgi:hypothetical protein
MPARPDLFRRQALEHYVQSRERTILPRVASPPVFLLMWILLGLATLALVVAWLGQVPVYMSGSGIVIEQTSLHNRQTGTSALAVIFVPVAPGHPVHLHTGSPVVLQIGMHGQTVTTSVDVVEPAILSPGEIRQRYTAESKVPSLVTGPSMIVSVTLGPAFASPVYAGSLVIAQLQVGSTSVLSLLFGSTQLEENS